MNVNNFIKKHILTIIQLDNEYLEFEKREAEKFHKRGIDDFNTSVLQGGSYVKRID